MLLMVVRLVAHGNLLFSELRQPLAVDLDSTGDRRDWGLILKDTPHVMEQSSD